MLPWLDDFAFFLHGSRAQAVAARDHSFATLRLLGITRNVAKGQPEPSHFLEDHLGYGIDSERGLFLLTERREASLRSGAAALMARLQASVTVQAAWRVHRTVGSLLFPEASLRP